MFNLEEAYLGRGERAEPDQTNESAVDWDLLGIYADYLRDQGLMLQCAGIEYLIANQLRPRSGVLVYTDTHDTEFWWYYRGEHFTDYHAMNRIPDEIAPLLTGRRTEEGSDRGVVAYPSLTEAIQDFGRAWEQWKNSEEAIS